MAVEPGVESALPQLGDKQVFKLSPLHLKKRAQDEITFTYKPVEKKHRCVKCGYDGEGWWLGECLITDDMGYPLQSHISICPVCMLRYEKFK